MTFNKGDTLTLDADGTLYHYTVYGEEIDSNGIQKIITIDQDGDYVALTKPTIIKRIGISWCHIPLYQITLPEDLFTL